LQREIVSTLPTIERFTRRPRIVDVDDAIYLFRSGQPARHLAQLADTVICGNNTLADWFSQHARHVVVLPTPVDTAIYLPRPGPRGQADHLTVGWIGTSSNLDELVQIEDAIRAAMREIPRFVLKVIADKPPCFKTLPEDRVHFVRWSAQHEIRELQSMDIGLMPLRDTAWNRGKCSFKMLQYLACGVPAIVSPVGMNADVLRHGRGGIAASDIPGWTDALLHLICDSTERTRMGNAGRAIAEQHFSVVRLAPVLEQTIRRLVP
jgi:glycosyltransferase involved in cell wall biosynthesis